MTNRFLFALLLLMGVATCGQKGPLYLPEEPKSHFVFEAKLSA